MANAGKPESIDQLFHKEKNQKKYNKTIGHYDKVKKYTNDNLKSSDKSTTSDKLIRREANYLKNIHIDKAFENLLRMELISDTKYRAWWCGVLHKLGVAFVMVQADLAIKNGKNPAALFHFMINKELNKSIDPYMPRFK